MGTPVARTWLLRLMAVALGLLLVGLVELGLRGSGRWADPPSPTLPAGWDQGTRLVDGELGPPLERVQLDGQAGWSTSRRLVQDRFMHDLRWTEQPPPDRLRVFTFGGSTTYGVPVEATPAQTFPGRMADSLAKLGMPAEVLNLGGASFGSDQVVALMRGVQGHGAAAWVVYAANNEFFQYQVALYADNAGYPLARRSLQRWHLFRALSALPAPAPVAQDDAVRHQEQVIARVIEATLADPAARPAVDGEGRWRRRDPAHRAVVARYRANLAQMERLAADAGARLFLVDVQPHLQQEPWLSLHDPALGARAAARVEARVAESAAARAQGDAAAAEAHALEAVELDPMYAAGWHALGMARLERGQTDAARRALENALELDMNPGRPLAGLSQALAEVTADGGSALVAVDRLWSDPAAGPFGARLFHDSCHLTPEAYDKLGRHLAMTLRLELPAR